MPTLQKSRSKNGGGKWKARFGLGRRNSKGAPPVEEDNGEARSLSAKRNQRLTTPKEKKTSGSFMRKLNVKTETPRGKNAESRDAQESSPSNPQSPLSDESFMSVEVSDDCNDKKS